MSPAPKTSARTRATARAIGEQIRAARLEAQISQEALARQIGMSRSNYARVEQGRTNVTIDTLLRIADGLGLAWDFTLTRGKGRKGKA